jgi:hypothetical protein
MNLAGILEHWASVLSTDEALDDWCELNYAKGVTVYIGGEGPNMPGEADCPHVILGYMPVSMDQGQEEENPSASVDIGWALYDKSHDDEDQIVRLSGVSAIGAMGDLIWDALQADGTYLLSQAGVALDPGGQFPLFKGEMAILAKEVAASGQTVLGIQSCTIYPMTSETTSRPLYGDPVSLQLTSAFDYAVTFDPRDGNNGLGVVTSDAALSGITWGMTIKALDAATLAVLLGGSSLALGQKAPYFRMDLVAVSPEGGTTTIQIDKAKVLTARQALGAGALAPLSLTGIAVARLSDQREMQIRFSE